VHSNHAVLPRAMPAMNAAAALLGLAASIPAAVLAAPAVKPNIL
jgi:hypothetical protein